MLGDPVSAGILLALTVGSVAARQQGREAVIDQQNEYWDQEYQRQKAFGDKSRALVAQGAQTAGAENQTARREQIAQDLGQAYTNVLPTNLAFDTATPAPAGKEVKQEAARRLHQTLGEGREYAKRTARLQSLPTLQAYTGIDLGDIYSQLGTLQNFSQGSSAITPYEMQAANQEAEPWNAASDLLGAAGDIYGLSKWTEKPAKVPRTAESRTYGGGQSTDPSIWDEQSPGYNRKQRVVFR